MQYRPLLRRMFQIVTDPYCKFTGSVPLSETGEGPLFGVPSGVMRAPSLKSPFLTNGGLIMSLTAKVISAQCCSPEAASDWPELPELILCVENRFSVDVPHIGKNLCRLHLCPNPRGFVGDGRSVDGYSLTFHWYGSIDLEPTNMTGLIDTLQGQLFLHVANSLVRERLSHLLITHVENPVAQPFVKET